MIRKVRRLPKRESVPQKDRWDLASLYPDNAAWERAMKRFERMVPKVEALRGTLREGPERIAECIAAEEKLSRLGERIGTYAFLRTAENVADGEHQAMFVRYQNAASRAGQATSFVRPELLRIPRKTMREWLDAKPLKKYRLHLERILRYRAHTLSEKEEKLLAMQAPVAAASRKIFDQLTDADLRFGTVKDDAGDTVELTHATFSALLHSPSRRVRRQAFETYYSAFESHRNTIAATLEASVRADVFHARARGFDSSLEASLFDDDVPVSVYDNLIASVHRMLPTLYRYFELRRRKLRLKEIHHYDTYVPILHGHEKKRPWNQAVRTVVRAVAPLGAEYRAALEKGLTEGRWCDRYENQGKHSGAFSCGSYDGEPYILMNYQEDVIDHLFTLAHEAGHSMHSWHSARKQPYLYYDYCIFTAEVASTFNEQLLSRHLLARAKDDGERAFLINREIDSMRATIIRQTMFAEFEKVVHEIAERDEALTVDRLTGEYRKLLELYFGPDFTLDPQLSLECLRIPHFYRAFYVFQYATGMSAAIALCDRVASGGQQELDDYLGFLRGGGSKFPLELLREAGVDLERPDAVDAALDRFGGLVDELESLL